MDRFDSTLLVQIAAIQKGDCSVLFNTHAKNEKQLQYFHTYDEQNYVCWVDYMLQIFRMNSI